MSGTKSAAGKRLRFAPLAIATGVLGAVLLSVSMSGTLSGFVASITNSTNTAATGALTMQEVNTGTGGATCNSTDTSVANNTFSCSTINKFGGSTTMIPSNTAGAANYVATGTGATTNVVTTNITIKNTGSVTPSTFTLTPAACTQSVNAAASSTGGASDYCAKLNVIITSGSTTVFSGTAAQLAVATATTTPAITMPAAPAATVAVPFTFKTFVDSTATNAYQGLSASEPLTWTFNS